ESGLLHVAAGGRDRKIKRIIVVAVQAPGPLHCTRAEHQCAAGCAIESEMVSGCSGAEDGSVVQQISGGQILGGGGKFDEAGGAKTVVGSYVPLVAERSSWECEGLS